LSADRTARSEHAEATLLAAPPALRRIAELGLAAVVGKVVTVAVRGLAAEDAAHTVEAASRRVRAPAGVAADVAVVGVVREIRLAPVRRVPVAVAAPRGALDRRRALRVW